MQHLSSTHRFGAANTVCVVQTPFVLKDPCSISHTHPLEVAHGDVTHACDRVTQTGHDVSNGELVCELREVNDAVVVSQPNAIGGDERNGGH